jgi:DNA-binding NtrC family response regulator
MSSLNTSPARILIADDEPDVRTALRLLLKAEGYQSETAPTATDVLDFLKKEDFDVVLMDLNFTRGTTSGKEGLDLLGRIRELDDALPVVVITAWASIELAVEAMRRGAGDFVPKPWRNERLLAVLRTQIALGQALREGRRLRQENQLLRGEGQPFIAASRAMRPVLEMIARAAPSDANILLTGESGTGKEVAARAIHAASARSEKPMVPVNMGGFSETLFEAELFGHVKGAFTDAHSDRIGRFELAQNGTLFLDEIANIPLGLQPKLLRVLETGEFEPLGSSKTRRADVRILSATNADLQREAAEGRFREDLLYRLNTLTIALPPLRERVEDIPLLAEHFRRRHVARYRKPITGFDPSALEMLLHYSWPGNIRELDHTVERAVLMTNDPLIRESDLGVWPSGKDVPRSLDDMSLEEVERVLIKKTLSRCDGNVSEAAKALGLSRSALYRRLYKFGL